MGHSMLRILGALVIEVVFAMMAPVADALPLYARQTGQQCAACHNGFPELTPYGRLFKLNGYTFGGGQSDIPPVSVMGIASFTHTSKDEPGQNPNFGANDNAAFEVTSLFTGGRITSNVGAFIQATYDNTQRAVHWDNLDVRYAGVANWFGGETVLGVSLNNNPSVTDPWNSTPAWGYPYQQSPLVAVPGAAPLLQGGTAQQVIGLNAYAYVDRLVYGEVGLYRTLSPSTFKVLGVDPYAFAIVGAAPYWRLAVEPQWGRNSFEVGTFGFAARLQPTRVNGNGTDQQINYGVDAQYQFLADEDSVSVQASYVVEDDTYDASLALGNASNDRDHLRSFKVKSSYWYDQTYGATAGYFQSAGTADPTLYSGLPSNNGKPNSAGLIAEVNYMPFNRGGPSFSPWVNMKVGLQYIHYLRFNGSATNFDGAGANAADNDTLYLYVWFAF